MANLDITWGPYSGQIEATSSLRRFVDKACGPTAGIAWTTNGILYPLRSPVRGKDGDGNVVVFEWRNGPAPELKVPPKDFWQRVEGFIEEVLAQQGREQLLVGQGDLAMGRAVGQAFRGLTPRQIDGIGVALDAVAVVLPLTAALVAGGIEGGALVALGAGGLVLLADGAAYGLELSGYDHAAALVKDHTELLRLGATLISIPDLLKAPSMLMEVLEAGELFQKATTTGYVAARWAASTPNVARAAEYSQISEKAYLRAQLLRQQMRGALAYELAPRLAGVSSTGLLFREEIAEDRSLLNEIVRRLQLYSVAVHK